MSDACASSELPPYEVRWHAAGSATALILPSIPTASFATHYPVALVDGSVLELPLRALPGGSQAIALLMSNQTPFEVEAKLVPLLTELAQKPSPDAIAAVPTMGLDYGRAIARDLGHANYVALGLSRKFWYDEGLGEPVSSSTSPEHAKSLYLDPALVSRVAGSRVVLVDDVINTGSSALAAIRLLQRAGARVEGLVVALTEGHQWRTTLAALGADWPSRVYAAGHIPMFERRADGLWQAEAATL